MPVSVSRSTWSSPQEWWRSLVFAVFVLGVAGTTLELLLLGHYEDRWQLVPLVLGGLSLSVSLWYVLSSSSRPVQLIRVLSLLTAASAVAGIVLHFQANVEWELEVTPDLQGMALFREVITGALPLLAPGAMLQLGLLGLLFSFRHPRLAEAADRRPPLATER